MRWEDREVNLANSLTLDALARYLTCPRTTSRMQLVCSSSSSGKTVGAARPERYDKSKSDIKGEIVSTWVSRVTKIWHRIDSLSAALCHESSNLAS